MNERSRASEGYRYAEEVRAVLERATEAAERGDAPPPRGRPFLLRAPVLVLVAAALASVVFYNVERWTLEPEPRPREVEEASLEVGVTLAGQMVEAFREEHGRLPASLAEVGLPERGLSYRVEDGAYEIFASGETLTVRLDSRVDPVERLRALELPPFPEDP